MYLLKHMLYYMGFVILSCEQDPLCLAQTNKINLLLKNINDEYNTIPQSCDL